MGLDSRIRSKYGKSAQKRASSFVKYGGENLKKR